MELVQCQKKYWSFIRSLRNKLKEGFIDQSHIKEEEHHSFMEKYHQNYFICLDNAEPIGFIGSVRGDIRVAVSKPHQKKGVGKFMLEGFLKKHSDGYATIKIDNQSSLKLFESCGFKKKFYILETNNLEKNNFHRAVKK
tara:strand:- start:271 stop:687 length:417 start_codon:yes stop_codon:yes gene_type:complete